MGWLDLVNFIIVVYKVVHDTVKYPAAITHSSRLIQDGALSRFSKKSYFGNFFSLGWGAECVREGGGKENGCSVGPKIDPKKQSCLATPPTYRQWKEEEEQVGGRRRREGKSNRLERGGATCPRGKGGEHKFTNLTHGNKCPLTEQMLLIVLFRVSIDWNLTVVESRTSSVEW